MQHIAMFNHTTSHDLNEPLACANTAGTWSGSSMPPWHDREGPRCCCTEGKELLNMSDFNSVFIYYIHIIIIITIIIVIIIIIAIIIYYYCYYIYIYVCVYCLYIYIHMCVLFLSIYIYMCVCVLFIYIYIEVCMHIIYEYNTSISYLYNTYIYNK